ncbi:endonuclease domain-containing protein [Pontibacter sp. BT731]|uniref:endonuclease domain-containing protein n=1 Tax=Pontibacter coccineus TaxID=3063328 RepID=UPI0026E15E6C|nr:endonuclease domain-containing protein [Pontibacter sp. BT731]MDO6389487.1 endonuclease domain-containing protein [Pontibacter sp. BT731]
MKRQIIPYKPYLRSLAKQLRQNSTLSEVLLWNELKNRQLLGYDFDRQKPLDSFIVDFYCKELQLAIEVDGDCHDYSFEEDAKRQATLEKLGIKFLRFNDREVKQELSNVLRTIEAWIIANQKK